MPDMGGVRDQDYGTFIRMRYLKNVYTTLQYMRGLTGDRINTGLSTGQRLLMGDLVNMGINLNG